MATMLSVVVLAMLVAVRANELDDYVNAPDPNYSWELVDTFTDPILRSYDGYTLRLTSQRWGEGLVIPEHELWVHYLTFIIPRKTTDSARDLGLLYMTGGSRTSGLPRPVNNVDLVLAVLLATNTGMPVAALFQSPNQPCVYLDDPEQKPRREDDFIGYGWRKFLTDPNPDPTWLARFPMTKAGVRAMDAFTEFMAQQFDRRVTEFVVAGASKRGWSTWTVAAVDKRVAGAIPIVMDELNLRENLRHHQQMLAGWSYAFSPYYNQNITALLDSPRLDDLMRLVDPYSYRDRYIATELPIYMISASGDQFFMPDDSTFFRSEMGSNFFMQMLPNAEHTTALAIDKVVNGVSGFVDTITRPGNTRRPIFNSIINETTGAIFLRTETTPRRVRVWSATSADTGRKDFRLTKLDEDGNVVVQLVRWSSEDLPPIAENTYMAELPTVPGRWRGFFIDIEFEGTNDGSGSGNRQRYTSDVSIVPRTFPVPPCFGESCRSILV